MSDILFQAQGLEKHFILHNQGGARIDTFAGLDLTVHAGECVVLGGPSGAGKSTLMRAIYGNYLASGGVLNVAHRDEMVDLRTASPYTLTQIRRESLGYVSQFLRVIPRVATLDLVMEPLLERGVSESQAEHRARELLTRLNLPEGHWSLPPATFSGGEQQRVNVARGFAPSFPVMLLDEPTASLDAGNKQVVIDLIKARLSEGGAVVGIFHDADVRDALDARIFDLTAYAVEA